MCLEVAERLNVIIFVSVLRAAKPVEIRITIPNEPLVVTFFSRKFLLILLLLLTQAVNKNKQNLFVSLMRTLLSAFDENPAKVLKICYFNYLLQFYILWGEKLTTFTSFLPPFLIYFIFFSSLFSKLNIFFYRGIISIKFLAMFRWVKKSQKEKVQSVFVITILRL